MISRLFAFLFLLFSCGPALAAPTPAAIFGEHMVLQRGRPIPIWGTAKPGEIVTVSLNTGARASATADIQGRWKAVLPSMDAGGPFTMKIADRDGAVTLRDVMIGEVWLLSGQSNMTFPLHGASNADQALATADRPDIRLFTVAKASALQPQNQLSGAWRECTPASTKDFSAVAYFFGVELAKRVHVPIGLIHGSWPGSTAEEWVDTPSLQRDPVFAPILRRWQDAPESAKLAAQDGFPFSLEFSDFALKEKSGGRKTLSDFTQGSSENAFGGAWSYSWRDAPFTNFTLTPTAGTASTSRSGFVAQWSGKLRDQDTALLRLDLAPGGKPFDLSAYAALEFRVRGTGFYQLQFLEPSIEDDAYYQSPVLQGSDVWQTVDIPFSQLKQPDWGKQMPWTQNSLTGFQFVPLMDSSEYGEEPPSGFYNGMIAPLIPISIRGVVWYQGESNALRAYQYRKLLPALIEGWRGAWHASDLPFLIVQLPNHGPAVPAPQQSAWAELREAQMMAARLPHTALVVTIDLGQENNLHPPDKVDVGKRLALAAEATVYGQRVAYSGPLYESAQIEADKIVLRFRDVFAGLRTRDGKPLRGFAIAGADRKFVWAEAQIAGDWVIVSSPTVSHPIAVRYDWADSPDGNLTNNTEIPASPFRIDNWPGITAGND
ncbi:MAG: CIA30 family protein [Acidobacteriaceae bacterium]